jgi:hypothetical protein
MTARDEALEQRSTLLAEYNSTLGGTRATDNVFGDPDDEAEN